MIMFDNGDELLLRDVTVRVLVQLEEQLLSFGHVCWATNHLIHSKNCPENINR
jgi:hypothetical protein